MDSARGFRHGPARAIVAASAHRIEDERAIMIKTLIGYTLVPGITPQEYDEWLWKIHTPDLLANPHLDKIVYNTVLKPVESASGNTMRLPQSLPLYRIAEMHFRDMAAYEAYRAWFQEHPLPPERGPAGRTDFKFYLLAEVAEATR
jgi:hypothetical protein